MRLDYLGAGPAVQLPIIPINGLKESELLLQRAHHVLSFTLHFYAHTLPPKAPVKIPPPLALPLLQVSAELQVPPTRTYADDILNNWILPAHYHDLPTIENIHARNLFTGTTDEDEFYMTTARIELRGAELINLMEIILIDAASVDADANAIQRITHTLTKFSTVIPELRTLLLAQRDKVDPDYFYNSIRPWIAGDRSETPEGRWVFEGIEHDPSLQPPTEFSGPSAAQSPIIQSLDVFLGVHDNNPDTAFIRRMRLYMPRRHRAFLEHLGDPCVTQSLRKLVRTASDTALMEAYNGAVRSLKEFRDAHTIIFKMYVVGPARKLAKTEVSCDNDDCGGEEDDLKDLSQLLKGFRDRTTGAHMDSSTS
jgi:indoleamine 2,3-dioxygenase